MVKIHHICNCDSSDLQLAIALQQQEFEQQPPRQDNLQQKSSISGTSRLVTGPQVYTVLDTCIHIHTETVLLLGYLGILLSGAANGWDHFQFCRESLLLSSKYPIIFIELNYNILIM